MAEGIDLSDMVEDFMSRQPVEQPETGAGLFVVDKWGNNEKFIPVTRAREEDAIAQPAQVAQEAQVTQVASPTIPDVVLNSPVPPPVEAIQNRPPIVIDRVAERKAEEEVGLRSNLLNGDVKMFDIDELSRGAAEIQRQKEREARRQYLDKFIGPIRSFLADTVTEAGDALARLKEAAASMSYSNDIWEVYTAQAEGKQIDQIGGIPLPKEYPTITKKAGDFIIAGHTGFGERTLPSHNFSGEGMQKVGNTLSGLERGVQAGANLLEVDLMMSSSGEILLFHKLPGQKDKQLTADEFLARSPESLTLAESITWLRAQDESIQLFLELKSKIPVATVVEQIKSAIPKIKNDQGELVDDQAEIDKTLRRLCIYGYQVSDMIRNRTATEILQQKQALGLNRDQLKVVYLTNGILTRESVKKIVDENKGLYALEQGMMPWGFAGEKVPGLLKRMTGLLSRSSVQTMIDYAHAHGIKVITGTANDPSAIHELVRMGFDGIVPDNPVDMDLAGIKIEGKGPKPELNDFVPLSMGERLSQANQAADTRRAEEQTRRSERANRWQNRRDTLRNLMRRRGIATATT